MFDNVTDRILTEAKAIGVTIKPEGDLLAIAPAGKVSPAMLADIRQHKPELLARLTLPHWRAGRLVIPFTSDRRFHWWEGGQRIGETKQELPPTQRSAAFTSSRGRDSHPTPARNLFESGRRI